jgi:K+-sensing histidine kinase KdpD
MQDDLAHKLLTPLTTIKGYVSSLLQSDAADSPELQQEFLRAIDRAADQLNEAIRRLLASIQYEPDHLQTSRTIISIPDLLKKAEAHLAGEGWKRSVKFHCYQDLPLVLVSQPHILQVISHLAHYADEAAAPGPGLEVAVLCPDSQPLIRIEISSNELRIDYRSEGFVESAWNSNEPQEYALADTDLRLIICCNILKAHNSLLHGEMPLDEAVKFWFTLPTA